MGEIETVAAWLRRAVHDGNAVSFEKRDVRCVAAGTAEIERETRADDDGGSDGSTRAVS